MKKLLPALLLVLFATPAISQEIIGRTTAAACLAQGGIPDSTITSRKDPDPIRPCRRADPPRDGYSVKTAPAETAPRPKSREQTSNIPSCPEGEWSRQGCQVKGLSASQCRALISQYGDRTYDRESNRYQDPYVMPGSGQVPSYCHYVPRN